MPCGGGRIFVATGYDKLGMTNAVAAALDLAGQILNDSPSWAKPLHRRPTGPRAAAQLVRGNAEVALSMTLGLVAAELRGAPEVAPAEGESKVGRESLVPVGRSTVGGTTCSVVALCTHLGGTLKWNDFERSWDCPLHGSRFAPDGQVLEGPATRGLRAAPPSPGSPVPGPGHADQSGEAVTWSSAARARRSRWPESAVRATPAVNAHQLLPTESALAPPGYRVA